MRTVRLATVCVALVTATLVSGAALAKDARPAGAPTNLRGFLLKPNEPVSHVFPRTPAFAWTPVRGARCYEFELATSRGFTENAVVWSNVQYGVGPAKACQAVAADSPPTAGADPDASSQGSGQTTTPAPTTPAPTTPTGMIQPLRVPAVSVDVALPWFTGNPYALFARVRAVTTSGPTRWSKPFAFNMRWPSVPAPQPTQAGLVRWSQVPGATGYQVWYPDIDKSFTTHTNVADLRDVYTFHRGSSDWWQTVKWRVRAVRRVSGTIPNGLPAVSYGPWSPVYRTVNPPLGAGPIKLGVAVSDARSSKRSPKAHELMPAFSFSGDRGLDGRTYSLFRTYVSTDSDCVNVVFRGSVIGSPAFAPRTTGPLALPDDGGVAASGKGFPAALADGPTEGASLTWSSDWRSLVASETIVGGAGATTTPPGSTDGTTATDESLNLLGARVDLPDIDFPATRYYWTVVPVKFAVKASDDQIKGYVDVESPQDACASGRVASFGKESAPVRTGAGNPFVAGLTPSGRLLASSTVRPTVFSTPLVAWQPAIGATAYEVQWSQTRYPWKPVGSKRTFATSAVLDLTPGTWFYRVRGLNQAQLRKAEMAWSRPVAMKVARPTFSIVGG